MPETKVTLKDIYNSIETLRHEIQETYVSKESFQACITPMQNDIKSIKSNLSKGVWAVLVLIIAGLLKIMGINQ